MTNSPITHSIRSNSWLLALVVLVVGLQTMAHAKNSPICRRWLDKVAQNPKHTPAGQSPTQGSPMAAITGPPADPWGVDSLSEAEKMEAMQCLLRAENDLRPAAFGSAVRFDVSQTFAQPHVNLAALYAISYIYTGRYDHAAAVALRGEDASYTDSKGNYVTKARAIHKAYRAYREWFAKVRQTGLASAQKSGAQPLEGTGLRWY